MIDLFNTLAQLREKTQCAYISFSVDNEELDTLSIDFIHTDEGLQFNVNIACEKDELVDLDIDKIAEVYFAEVEKQKELAEVEITNAGDCD